MKTKLPEVTTPCSDPEIQERDWTAKAKMKTYHDNKRYVKPSTIKEGDAVFVKRDDSKKKSAHHTTQGLSSSWRKKDPW